MIIASVQIDDMDLISVENTEIITCFLLPQANGLFGRR